MKKVININFHSRVIPIEETAYDILKQYVEKLRRHFANEEGGDEIVNDIENRFAELFSDKLKKGAVCITDGDVSEVIASMGNPEDFDQEESARAGQSRPADAATSFSQADTEDTARSLYRSENDKILGGVCGGLAVYLKIDPSIVRIIYALLSLGSFGFGLIIYFVLWAVLPVKSQSVNIRKRLYRNPDQRVIGGVASGLAAYFHIEVWIPRLIFALPFILALIHAIFHHFWFDFDGSSRFITGGFGGSLIVAYIILWIVVPEANTASEKLEMRGEKIDIESIKNTIKNDLGGFKQRASEIGAEVKQRAQEFGNEMKQKAPDIKANISNIRRSNGVAHAIGVLFRAFFLFIGICCAFGLIVLLIGLIFSGAGFMPLKNYFVHGFWEHLLAWATLILVICIPIIAMLTWFIRRIIGARSKSHHLGYVFGGLWVMGLICFFILFAMLTSKIRMRDGVADDLSLTSPTHGKMIVKVTEDRTTVYNREWFGIQWDNDAPFYNVNEDSIMMNTVRVSIEKSDDTAWHIRRERLSRGSSQEEAKGYASQIGFSIDQHDSLLYLPEGFAITPHQQFRNQQVLLMIQVPVGKKILIDGSVDEYRWFNVNINRNRRNWNIEVNDDEWSAGHPWESNVEYVMTDHGIEKTRYQETPEKAEQPERKEQPGKKEKAEKKETPENSDEDNNKTKDEPKDDGGYRYHRDKPSAKVENKEKTDSEGVSPLEIFSKWI
jgi:phage shock protein PspC (stress-responsive transcriptional regulator)